MKTKRLLTGFLLGALALTVIGAATDFLSFNTNQFFASKSANTVTVKNGSNLTNVQGWANFTLNSGDILATAGNVTAGLQLNGASLSAGNLSVTAGAGGGLVDAGWAKFASVTTNAGDTYFTQSPIAGATIIGDANGKMAWVPTTSFLNTSLVDQKDWAIDDFDAYTATNATPVLTNGPGWYGGARITGGSIVTRTLSGYAARTENRLSISNGVYARTFAWGSEWKRIKIGVLWRLNTNATQSLTNLYFGICCKTNSTPFDTVCTNYIGTGNAGTAFSAGFNTGNDYNYFLINPLTTVVRTNATDTGIAGGSLATFMASGQTNHNYFMMDIERPNLNSAGTYTMRLFSSPNTQEGRECDWSYRALYRLMNDTSLAAFNTTTASGTISWQQSFGPLDTLTLWHSHVAAPLEISAFLVFKCY